MAGIEHRTVRLLQRHDLAGGMLARGKAIGACEFRHAGGRHVFDYAALSGAAHYVYPQQLLVGDLVDSLRSAGSEIRFGVAVESIRLAEAPVIMTSSSTRLPAIWQAVEFSHGMLQLLLARQPGTAEATFHEGLRQARLTRLMNDEAFARAFALAYVGVDP